MAQLPAGREPPAWRIPLPGSPAASLAVAADESPRQRGTSCGVQQAIAPTTAAVCGCPCAETYVTETAKDRVVVTWNMELDTLRSDLGASPCFGPPVLAGWRWWRGQEAPRRQQQQRRQQEQQQGARSRGACCALCARTPAPCGPPPRRPLPCSHRGPCKAMLAVVPYAVARFPPCRPAGLPSQGSAAPLPLLLQARVLHPPA